MRWIVSSPNWLAQQPCETIFITPGSPWENPYIESFFDKLRQECLNCDLVVNVREAQQILENWRYDYNHYRPHSSLDYLTPVEFVAELDAGEQRTVTDQIAIPVRGVQSGVVASLGPARTRTVLLPALGNTRDVNPFLVIGHELKRRGHRAILVSNPHFSSQVEATGLEFLGVDREQDHLEVIDNSDLWHPTRSF